MYIFYTETVTDFANVMNKKYNFSPFLEWLVTRGLSIQFEEFETTELADLLKQFYGELRKKDGNEYSKSSLINVRAAINRHLTSAPYNLIINVIRDPPFQQANQVFTALIKELRRQGNDNTQHKVPISPADMEKLYSSGTLSCENPKSLQNKVYLELSLHFARRGREGLRELRKDSFAVGTDSTGNEYVFQTYHEKEKIIQVSIPRRKKNKLLCLLIKVIHGVQWQVSNCIHQNYIHHVMLSSIGQNASLLAQVTGGMTTCHWAIIH